MSQYTKSTNFATKDNLSPGDPLKIVRGTEIDTEFNNISTAISTKTDNSAAAITGGSITGITDLAIADGGTGASTATAALNNLLPSQTGNSSKYLQTDGTNATWDAISINTGDITGTLPVANGGTGITSFGTGIATFLGTPSSANLISAVTDETGSGALVFANSPTLVTPTLGTPASATLTNATGLPISTGVSGLGTGVATFLATPSSANLRSALTDETGTGSAVFATSPALVTPDLGTPSAATLTNATGLPIATGVSGLGTGVATFLATPSSANLRSALTDETGTGSAVFATSPTLVTPILGTPTSATLTNATGLPISTGVSGLGTGIATALAVNTGSAGAPVLFNGALGTPSGGTVTNLTGTASININGTVGATTATTGAFTTLTTTGTINLLTVGRGAGAVATNTAVGASALAANTTGLANAAFGYNSQLNNTTGQSNTSIGNSALGVNTTGSYNTAIGNAALLFNTTASNNTAVGYQAGYSNTTGTNNAHFGYQAGYSASTATQNTFIGDRAGYATTVGENTGLGARSLIFNTTGANNVAVGKDSLYSNTTASNNTAVGYQAAYTNQTGTNITAVGYRAAYTTTVQNEAFGINALLSTTTGTANSAFGASALQTNTTGANNMAFGGSSLFSNTTGSDNIAIGDRAVTSNTTGSSNVGIGKQALQANTTASNNTAVGYQAAYTNQTGIDTVAVGYRALYTATGIRNTAIGKEALFSLNTGTNNLAIGESAGYSMTSGSKNVIIGTFSGSGSGINITTSNNYIVLSDGDGNVEFTAKDGNSWALPGATVQTGTGITFPATQSASSNANTLDDYEEGTFTPTVEGSTTAGTATYGRQAGYYTKIGRQVFISIDVIWSAGTGTGNLKITGLPFASNSATMIKNLCCSSDLLTLTASNYLSVATIGVSSTVILPSQQPVGGGSQTDVAYDAAAQITISGQYFV